MSDEQKRQYCIQKGIDPDQHCCLTMAFQISHPIEVPHQGPNRVIDWSKSWNEYRIPVAYDGYASTLIAFCPWCGKKLAESKQKLWYQTLYSLGYQDPGNDTIPEEFNTDVWWRKRGL